jgi:hypothetical protein
MIFLFLHSSISAISNRQSELQFKEELVLAESMGVLAAFPKFFSRMDFEMTNKLPRHIAEKVMQMPESSYGANKVRVTLKDGREYSSVFVAWGEEVVKLGSSTDIPFDADDIIELENDL